MDRNVIYSCGHHGVVDISCKKDVKRGNFRNCPKCRSELGIILYTEVCELIDRRSGQLQYKLWFNDCVPEDTAKSLGFYKTKGVWVNFVLEKHLKTALDAAAHIGATTFVQDRSLLSQEHLSTAKKSQQRWINMMQSIHNLQPQVPDFISGKHWNNKIYGHPGRTKIFLNGTETVLSSDQEESLRIYLSQREGYEKRARKLKAKFVQ